MNGVNPQRPRIRFSRPSRFPEIVQIQSQCHTTQPPSPRWSSAGGSNPGAPSWGRAETLVLVWGLVCPRTGAGRSGEGAPAGPLPPAPVRTGPQAGTEDTEQSGGREAVMRSPGAGRRRQRGVRAAVRSVGRGGAGPPLHLWLGLHRAHLWQAGRLCGEGSCQRGPGEGRRGRAGGQVGLRGLGSSLSHQPHVAQPGVSPVSAPW